mmetsp:Transcript_46436/g.132043  ORF Transcript_46436/g.132043 Transcript_46436/m.132043 type:complete len:207 (+) Transcript_46436:271-891(+)
MSSEGPLASTKANKRCRRQEQTAARQMNGRVMCRFACSEAERYLTCRHQEQTCQHFSCSCACASRARSGKTHKHSHSRISPVGKNSTPCSYQQRGAQSQQKDAMRPVAAAVPHWSTTACRRNAAVAAAAAAAPPPPPPGRQTQHHCLHQWYRWKLQAQQVSNRGGKAVEPPTATVWPRGCRPTAKTAGTPAKKAAERCNREESIAA